MMAGPQTSSTRNHGPELERTNEVGCTSQPQPASLQETLHEFEIPVVLDADPEQHIADLELTRLRLLEEAQNLKIAQEQLVQANRELAAVNGLETPAARGPSRLAAVRQCRGCLGKAISAEASPTHP